LSGLATRHLCQFITTIDDRDVLKRRVLFLVVATLPALSACNARTTPSPSVTGAARTDTFLCRLVATTTVEHDRLVHALAVADQGDQPAAAAEARVAFKDLSDAMSNRPPAPLPSPDSASVVLMLAWPDVALAEMTLASPLAPDVRPLLSPVVEAHVALADLDRAVAAARTSSRQQDPNGLLCRAPW
jgi:hypothetical protein